MSRRRNRKNDSKSRKFIEVFKKVNENEKRKSIERKSSKKSNKPKGYVARRIGIFAFWFIFVLMTLIVIVNSAGSKSKVPTLDDFVIEENKSSSVESVEFARDFLSQYFSWNLDDYDRDLRTEKISYYVSKSISDEAGRVSDSVWHSTLHKNNILLKEVKELNDNDSILTFQLDISFDKRKSAIEAEREELIGSGDEESEVDESQIIKKVTSRKYVSVKVHYDESSGRYTVYELPSFTYLDTRPNSVEKNSEYDGLRTITGNESSVVKSFLETFFSSYATDPQEKLSYLIKDKDYQYGLNETMNYVRLKETVVYEGKNENENIVDVDVVFSDPDTGIEFTSNYLIILVKDVEEDRYVVNSINDINYIEDMLSGTDEEDAEPVDSPEEQGE